MKSFRIGEVSKASGTGIETIRFYEREGLLLKPERRPSGFRQYDQTTVIRLGYIRQAKELGFTLAEIKELLDLSSAQTCNDHIRQRAEDKIVDIDSKIHSLQKMKRSLGQILKRCQKKSSQHDCPLVHKAKKSTGE